MKSKSRNYQVQKREISENEMPGMRKEIPKEETFIRYGGAARKVEIEAIEKTWGFQKNKFLGNSGRGISD